LTPEKSPQVLAIGFLLVILSAALFHNFLTLLVVATYVIAPLPNWICGRCANPDDFMENAGNAVIDFGRFCTGFLVVMGVGKLRGVFVPERALHLLRSRMARLQNRWHRHVVFAVLPGLFC
jgi:hypothetical protein